MIKCKNCGKEHHRITSNCCWIDCQCGRQICGNCGYADEKWFDCSNNNNEDQYWCCQECPECGLIGCAMCI